MTLVGDLYMYTKITFRESKEEAGVGMQRVLCKTYFYTMERSKDVKIYFRFFKSWNSSFSFSVQLR